MFFFRHILITLSFYWAIWLSLYIFSHGVFTLILYHMFLHVYSSVNIILFFVLYRLHTHVHPCESSFSIKVCVETVSPCPSLWPRLCWKTHPLRVSRSITTVHLKALDASTTTVWRAARGQIKHNTSAAAQRLWIKTVAERNATNQRTVKHLERGQYNICSRLFGMNLMGQFSLLWLKSVQVEVIVFHFA